MNEKLLSSIVKNITLGLKEGTIKMGDTVPFTYAQGVSQDDNSPAPIYDALIITPDYKANLRKYYEEIEN